MRKSVKSGFAAAFISGGILAAVASFAAGSIKAYAADLEWHYEGSKAYWYEYGVRQGTYSDPKGVIGDGTVRGREIYDPVSNGWYWLDAVYDGAKAVSKEVWMPYVYQDEAKFSEQELENVCNASGAMASQVKKAIEDKTGKWVRYTAEGKMVKGWYEVNGDDLLVYPQQAGNIYYYEEITGLMAKGWTNIDGVDYYFDEVTGALLGGRKLTPKEPATVPSDIINVLDYGATPNDDTNDTYPFHDAIKAASSGKGRNTVYVPAGRYVISNIETWHSGGVIMDVNDVNLIMSPDAILDIAANGRSEYQMIYIGKAENIRIFGGKIYGERYKHTGTSGEGGHGIGVLSSGNVTIGYMEIKDNWGDGIYIGSMNDSEGPSNNVRITGCNIHGNRRSNISLVHCNNVYIQDCTIEDAFGTSPQDGINIEPNHVNGVIPPDRIIRNVRISDTTVSTYQGRSSTMNGDFYALATISNGTSDYWSSDNIEIRNCTFNGDVGNYSATNFSMYNSVVNGQIINFMPIDIH